jgi:hypothetical protein
MQDDSSLRSPNYGNNSMVTHGSFCEGHFMILMQLAIWNDTSKY